jgi:hypothetical protein
MTTLKFAVLAAAVGIGMASNASAQAIPVPGDPGASYSLVSIKKVSAKRIEVVSKRVGRSGTSYARRLVDCGAMTFKYLGEGDTLQEALLDGPDIKMSALTDGSASHGVSVYACRKSGL